MNYFHTCSPFFPVLRHLPCPQSGSPRFWWDSSYVSRCLCGQICLVKIYVFILLMCAYLGTHWCGNRSRTRSQCPSSTRSLPQARGTLIHPGNSMGTRQNLVFLCQVGDPAIVCSHVDQAIESPGDNIFYSLMQHRRVAKHCRDHGAEGS